MTRAGPLLVVLLSAARALADDDQCVLNGDGDVERCEKFYWRSRIAAVAIPAYVIGFDGQHARHGLAWTLAIDVPRDEWNEYFSLGIDKDALPRGFPSQLGVAASFVWYIGSSVEGRLVARARIISLIRPNNPAISFVHLTIGLGATGGTLPGAPGLGFAPRVELRSRFGHIAWGGVVLALGFTPYVSRGIFVGDLSVGVEAPWVWWW